MQPPHTTSKRIPPEVKILGRHHVLSVLDQDDAGTINLARLEGPSGFQRWVALRIVRRELARDPAFKRGFFEAARTGAAISHGNVAATLEVGETDGILWMASEYLHGERLSELLERTREQRMPIPWDIACRIAADVALGIDALHEMRPPGRERAGVVHGRFAPRHVVVTYDGKSKVLGVPIDAPGGRPLDARELPYAAPEVVDGAPPDARSDQHAVGVILWELVSGQRLFGGASEERTRQNVRAHLIPALRPMSLGCPERVDRIVARATAVDPAKRFSSSRELAQALQAALVTEALVVTDDDVARYMMKVFGDTFTEREEQLRSAADVTEVFRRGRLVPPSDTLPDGSGDEPPPTLSYKNEDTPVHTVRMPAPGEPAPRALAASPQTVQLAPPAAGAPPRVLELAPPSASRPPMAPRVSAAPSSASSPMQLPSTPTVRTGPGVGSAHGASQRVLLAVLALGTVLVVSVTAAGIYRTKTRQREAEEVAALAAAMSASAAAANPAPSAPSAPTASAASTAIAPSGAWTAVPAAPSAPSAVALVPPPPTATAAPERPPTPPTPRPPRPPRPPAAPSGATGQLTVVCVPACDAVYDGRTPLGPSPIFKQTLSVGPHRIRMKLDDPPTEKVVTVEITEDEVKVVRQGMD